MNTINFRKHLLTLFIFCFPILAVAQNAIIKGFVYDKTNGEPIIYTNVVIKQLNLGVQTDINGYFTFSQIKPGNYTLMVPYMGYDTAFVNIAVQSNDVITQKIFLTKKERLLKGVEVTARKTVKMTTVNAGVTTISPKEIKLLPSAGGEPDIAQYLQVMPGVIFTGDQGGQLYIRGGAPSQTGILLDGVTIYNPFHSIGLFSVFETDAIKSVDVMSAGFSALYGNRTSAILDVRTKDGNKNRTAGKLSASPIMMRAMLEGPLSKAKSENGGSATYILSMKHSYFDKTSSSMYSFLGDPFKQGLPYSFTDLYGKITLSGENGSKFNIFGFNFDDKAKVLSAQSNNDLASFNWLASGLGTNFVVTPAGASTLISGKFAYSKYGIDYKEQANRTRNSTIDGFEGAIDFTYFLKNFSLVKYGLEVSGQHTTLSYVNNYNIPTTLDRRNTTAALYLLVRQNFNEKLIIEPSFRVQYYSGLAKMSPEPRIGLKYNINSNVRLKAAAGVYSQNIISTKSDRDIVNFFSAFLLSPDEQVLNTSGQSVKSNLLTARHLLGGIEVDAFGIEFNLEPWYKNFSQNIELNRYKLFAADPNFITETGKAYGIDLSAKYQTKQWYLWCAASMQNVTRFDGKQTYAPPFDRRFNVNIVSSYTLGKNKEWDLSGRFNYGSPFPFTQTQGFFEQLNLLNNGIGSNYLGQNGSLGILYADQINGGRLSHYHRLDFSVKRKFVISKTNTVDATFSVTNVYDRQNIFYVNRVTNERVYQLPFFPSLNVTWNF